MDIGQNHRYPAGTPPEVHGSRDDDRLSDDIGAYTRRHVQAVFGRNRREVTKIVECKPGIDWRVEVVARWAAQSRSRKYHYGRETAKQRCRHPHFSAAEPLQREFTTVVPSPACTMDAGGRMTCVCANELQDLIESGRVARGLEKFISLYGHEIQACWRSQLFWYKMSVKSGLRKSGLPRLGRPIHHRPRRWHRVAEAEHACREGVVVLRLDRDVGV